MATFLAAARECVRSLLGPCALKPPVDLRRLADLQGAKLVRNDGISAPGQLTAIGSLKIEYRFDIKWRYREVICHELVHTFFTSGCGARFYVPSTIGLTEQEEEKICDLLCLELLLPRESFVRVVTESPLSWHRVREIADLFQTTTKAVIKRMLKLRVPVRCLLAYWEPLNREEPFGKHRLVRRYSLGGFPAHDFKKGTIEATRVLFEAYQAGWFGCDMESWPGYRVDCMPAPTNAGKPRQVFSLITIK